MNIKANAKINVSLKVKGLLENGYHDLEMVNLPIELHDSIEVQLLPVKTGDTFITCNDLRINPGRANLCHKAVEALRNVFKFDACFRINIYKEIPFSAGLGGGSSDAASTLLAVRKLLKLSVDDEKLKKIGLSVGSDVPFFLTNKPCVVTGIGENIETFDLKKNYHCLIVKPEKGLSTKEVYEASNGLQKYNINTPLVVEGLQKGDMGLIAKNFGNDLMPAALKLCPEVGEVYSWLRNRGFDVASMSGSGSSLFALTADHKKAKDAYHALEKTAYTVILTKTMC